MRSVGLRVRCQPATSAFEIDDQRQDATEGERARNSRGDRRYRHLGRECGQLVLLGRLIIASARRFAGTSLPAAKRKRPFLPTSNGSRANFGHH